jgi:hypothetical protein
MVPPTHLTARFNGCNTIWGIYIIINLLTRCINLFAGYDDSGAAKAAGSIIIIEY